MNFQLLIIYQISINNTKNVKKKNNNNNNLNVGFQKYLPKQLNIIPLIIPKNCYYHFVFTNLINS